MKQKQRSLPQLPLEIPAIYLNQQYGKYGGVQRLNTTLATTTKRLSRSLSYLTLQANSFYL